MPHIHQGADDPLCFTVGLRAIDADKLLADTVLPASFAESMIVSSFKFRAIIRISTVNLIMLIGSDYEGGCIDQGDQATQSGQGHRGKLLLETAIAFPADCELLN